MLPATEIYDEIIDSVIKEVRDDFAEVTDDMHALEDLKLLWRSKLFGHEKNNHKVISSADSPYFRNITLTLSYRRSDSQSDSSECKNFTVKVPKTYKCDNDIIKKLPDDIIRKIIILPQALATKVLQEYVNTVVLQENLPQTDGSDQMVDFDFSNLSALLSGDGILKTVFTKILVGEESDFKQQRSAKMSYDEDLLKPSEKEYGPKNNSTMPQDLRISSLTKAHHSSNERMHDFNVTNIRINSKVLQLDGTSSSDDSNSSTCSSPTSTSVDKENTHQRNCEEDTDSNDLNSEDDLSEEDDDLETENVVVCQYEKVIRRANRWKFILKSGVIKLNGEEFVFGKAFGSAEW